MRLSNTFAAIAALAILGAGSFVVSQDAPPKEAPKAACATLALLEEAARQALASLKAEEYAKLVDSMPNWCKERVNLEQLRARQKLESLANADKQVAVNLSGRGSLDPTSALKVADKAAFLALTRPQFFALDGGFLRLKGSATAQATLRGEWFLTNVESGTLKKESGRSSGLINATHEATVAHFESASRDRINFAFCDVDGRWMLCGWEISLAGFKLDSTNTGLIAGSFSIYDDDIGKLAEPVAKAKVTHILVKVGGTTKPPGEQRTADQAKALCEELWKRYHDAAEEDKVRVWKEMQVQYNEDGAPHNVYDVTPSAGLIKLFKDVALTTEVGQARIAPYDRQGSPYGYHLIRREE